MQPLAQVDVRMNPPQPKITETACSTADDDNQTDPTIMPDPFTERNIMQASAAVRLALHIPLGTAGSL
jgi:hypothetical protein